MQGDSDFDPSWPVAFVFGLLLAFTAAFTPTGRQLISDTLKGLSPEKPPAPLTVERPDVLVTTGNPDDTVRIAATVVPRGYSVLVARTTLLAEQLLQGDANRIGLIVVDEGSSDIERIVSLAHSLVPLAKLVKLPRKHGSTELAVLVLDAI
jgi:hypothetical protein